MAAPGPSTHQTKLEGYDFFRKVLGSPKYVVAPMVDQSELAWRRLSRKYGAQLIYTPMINARMFAQDQRKSYRPEMFDLGSGEEGGLGDRPLIVQFAANDLDWLLKAAKMVEARCDAVDINLGCPQDIARRGHYGSYLQDEWDLIYKMINNLHKNLSIPVTAKFRVFPTIEKTVEYAKMLESAGAQILTCHGRTREQRGHNTGLADWEKIRAVKEAVSVPVIANGNILFHSDIEACLAATGADAVMSAEGNLYNPVVFMSAPASSSSLADPALPSTWCISSDGLHLPHTHLALEYLAIVKSQKTRTKGSAVKGHLFKLLRPALGRETDLRDRLGRIQIKRLGDSEAWDQYEALIKEFDERMQRDARAAEGRPVDKLITVHESTGLKMMPHWVAQPYFRAMPKVVEQAEKNEETAESVVAEGGEPQCASADVDIPPYGSAAGKRAPSERTPELDELAKRVKLVREDAAEPLAAAS
ncbi:uncharacterized protein PHACADRAFT_180642 [Phanerochaete carnosa HHB-10118-sp]|uniref:tRNA-dihydrouridine(16/17) synthase [NAD(P)(+)] n=1 Tax=Phanerochaete carnosa (strain HHB-10118-sp) TaxID=650164 RepID=K5XEM4_PHACS|nr:uncharacterized protein PHACADRAFT_180642 [Phanerochaete carnosa HHB-10118-sp]EKM61532.1 hypothetical protein PHACADRAFT_180642 [Phanerochaete carnosa HHB-10118-sp]